MKISRKVVEKVTKNLGLGKIVTKSRFACTWKNAGVKNVCQSGHSGAKLWRLLNRFSGILPRTLDSPDVRLQLMRTLRAACMVNAGLTTKVGLHGCFLCYHFSSVLKRTTEKNHRVKLNLLSVITYFFWNMTVVTKPIVAEKKDEKVNI